MSPSPTKPGKKWVPLESNPEVLNRFCLELGVAQEPSAPFCFVDILGLDEELLSMVPTPIHAILMCFPITEETEATAHAEDALDDGVTPPADLFYLKQTIGNACGTIAIIHAVCNNTERIKIDKDGFLSQFVESTKGMGAQERGRPASMADAALARMQQGVKDRGRETYLEQPPEGAPDIEAAHQAAAAEGDSAPPADDEEVSLHFVTFVHKAGHLWELDGRRVGPVCRGPTTPATLLSDTAAVVKGMVEKTNSLQFNLIAATGSIPE